MTNNRRKIEILKIQSCTHKIDEEVSNISFESTIDRIPNNHSFSREHKQYEYKQLHLY